MIVEEPLWCLALQVETSILRVGLDTVGLDDVASCSLSGDLRDQGPEIFDPVHWNGGVVDQWERDDLALIIDFAQFCHTLCWNC